MKETNQTAGSNLYGANQFEIAMVALMQVGANLFNVVIMMLSYMATGGWGLAVMAASQITAVLKVCDGFQDPIIGWFAPRVRTKIGVGTPLIVIGWIFEVITLVILFNVGPGLGGIPLYVAAYFLNILAYSCLNKGISFFKLNITVNPKLRPMFQRWSQIVLMILTGIMGVWRGKYLIPKHGGFNPSLLGEMNFVVCIVASVLILIGLIVGHKYDNAEMFTRNYRKATSFTLKDVWHLISKNPAFLTELIADITDKVGTNVGSNSAIGVLLFGIIIGNYGFSGEISIIMSAVSIVTLLYITNTASRKGSMKAYLRFTWMYLGLTVFTVGFMSLVDPTQISKAPIVTVIFVICYALNSASKSTINAVSQTMDLDVQDYEFYLHGKYLGPMVNAVSNMITKMFDSFSSIIVAACLGLIGYVEVMPQPGDPSSPMLFWVTMFLWMGMPSLGYIASIIVLRWYPLNAEKMEEVQRVNAETRAKNAALSDSEKSAKA